MSAFTRTLVAILAFPIFIVAIVSHLILIIYDSIFPRKFQEYVPLLDVNRTFLLALSRLMADPKRIEAETALNQISQMSEEVDKVAEGYALRKGIGQTVDFALSAVALSFGLIAFFSQDRFGEFGPILIFIFSSATMALSTFAGIFGPPYALAEQAKLFCLRHGNYRGAVIFKAIESILAIPFISSSAGFLILDMPPVDQESLEEFKGEMQEQLEEVAEKAYVFPSISEALKLVALSFYEDLGKMPLHINKPLYQFLAPLTALFLPYKFDGIWAMMAHSAGVPAAVYKVIRPKTPYLLTLHPAFFSLVPPSSNSSPIVD